jgi:predicted CXXCH cytochrome family protein
MTGLHIAAVALLLAMAGMQADASATPDSTQNCLSCHDFGPDSPVHAVQAGSHGGAGSADPAGGNGCADCHGASQAHALAPMQVAPEVSYGPRWTASGGDHDSQCLACHQGDQAAQWEHALHMFNNVTCVTCHDIHAQRDRVLFEQEQAQVCTTCHKTQQKGIHGRTDLVADNPPCSSCHNPHDHESAENQMLSNGSAGCRSCHDLAAMASRDDISKRALRSHKRMEKPDYTCLDCHEGVAHTPADVVSAMLPEPAGSRLVTLFYPGMADSDWLLQSHPGSQPLRQGRNCQQCHRGEEARMGQIQASGISPASREVRVGFSRRADQLVIALSWEGDRRDTTLALMWGDGGDPEFTRGGCFAACHSDMPGMSRDNGSRTGKYLRSSRQQQGQLGQPPLLRSPSELEVLRGAGEFVALWRLQLASGQLETALLLEELSWQPTNLIQIKERYMDGTWTVELVTPLNNTGLIIPFTPDQKYTLGIALNAAENPGGKHWVSLPLTFSVSGDDTDFIVEQ